MPATIYPIASTGAMLDIGQERSRENSALAAEPGCAADSNCASAPIGTIELSKKVSGSYNHPSGLTGGRCLTGIGLLMEGARSAMRGGHSASKHRLEQHQQFVGTQRQPTGYAMRTL